MYTRDELEKAFGIDLEIEDGWVPIVSDWYTSVQKHKFKVKPSQVKEKFGGLRIYFFKTSGMSDRDVETVNELISVAESIADRTCEVCGRPGSLQRNRSWLKTLCNDC